MTKALTTQNAQITTAAVEVKTLTISGKQVTLAVFRQLREEPLIAHDGALNGVPWGVVNYHPDKCADLPEHWHLIWQRGGELLRSRVEVKPESGPFESALSINGPQVLFGRAFVASHVRDLLLGNHSRFFGGGAPALDGPGCSIVDLQEKVGFRVIVEVTTPTMTGIEVFARLAQIANMRETDATKVWSDTPPRGFRIMLRDEARAFMESQREAVLKRLDAEIGPREDGVTANLHSRFMTAVEAEAMRRERHAATRTALGDLPQLFIAV